MPNITGSITIDFSTEKEEVSPQQFKEFKKKLNDLIFTSFDTMVLELAEEHDMEAVMYPVVSLDSLDID